MQSLTPEFFDTLIVIIIIIGMALAGVRLYRDFTRRLPNERSAPASVPKDNAS